MAKVEMNDDGRWDVVCEHGVAVTFSNKKLAKNAAQHIEYFCDECRVKVTGFDEETIGIDNYDDLYDEVMV